MTRRTAIKMIKRRAIYAGLPGEISNHSFRGTGITEYLRNGVDLETAAHITGHKSTAKRSRTRAILKLLIPNTVD